MKKIFPGYYATQDGKIWSTKQNKFLKTRKNNKGYELVNISIDGKVKTYSVHRLVAKAYLNNSKHLPTINHKDGDKTDNSVKNLEWTTMSDNELDAFDKGLVDRPNLKTRKQKEEESINKGKNMKKQIRLSESQLRKLVRETLNEAAYNGQQVSQQWLNAQNYYFNALGSIWKVIQGLSNFSKGQPAPKFISDFQKQLTDLYNSFRNRQDVQAEQPQQQQGYAQQMKGGSQTTVQPQVSAEGKSRRKPGMNEELKNVIHKEGGKWKIRGHKGKGDNEKDGDWAADYSSKEKAKAALRAYFANK